MEKKKSAKHKEHVFGDGARPRGFRAQRKTFPPLLFYRSKAKTL